MDELERELRAALDHLADGPEPSDALVGRTVERSVRIRRNRRVVAVTSLAAAFVATLAIVSIAGAATRRGEVDVTGPAVAEESTTTTATTVAPILFPTTTTNRRPASTTVPAVTPTTKPPCVDEPVVDDPPTAGAFTLLPNGNIEVSYYFPFGPAREDRYYILDDGTSGSAGFTKQYTPDEFGTHWYEMWSQLGGTPEDLASCKFRHNFVVDPSVVSPTTTLEPTTSVPVETTVPTTDTTIP